MTKATLKSMLYPGRKIRCVENFRGACDGIREVIKCRASEVVLKTESGEESILSLGKSFSVEETADGFVVTNPNFIGRIVYRWA